MSDSTQNPPDDGGSDGPPPPTPSPPQGGYDAGPTPPPPPPPPGQGSYGTGATPPPPGGWQQPGTMPPPPGGGAMTGGVGQPADLLPRFLARLIDYILLAVVNGILVSFVVVGTLMGSDAGSVTGWGMSSTSFAANAVATIITAAITLGYFALMESSRGQTVGKMLLKLQTQGPGGGNPTTEQALRRNAFTAIGVLGIVPFLGFVAGLLSLAAVIMIAVTINNNKQNRHGWHDDFAGGTTVVKIG